MINRIDYIMVGGFGYGPAVLVEELVTWHANNRSIPTRHYVAIVETENTEKGGGA